MAGFRGGEGIRNAGSAETANSDRCLWAGGGQVMSVGTGSVGGTLSTWSLEVPIP